MTKAKKHVEHLTIKFNMLTFNMLTNMLTNMYVTCIKMLLTYMALIVYISSTIGIHIVSHK